MTPSRLPGDAATLARRVAELRAGSPERLLLGLAGAPGSGKTTLARALVAKLGEDAVHLPMDGFHLADVQLRARGWLAEKGSPRTFDADGYARTLHAVRSARRTVFAPAFERDLEQPLAGAVAVEPWHRVVVTEGNYLLLDEPGWREARQAIDVVWYVETDEPLRQERLLARHVRFGKPAEQARSWVARVDEPNARLVAASAGRADAIVCATVTGDVAPSAPR